MAERAIAQIIESEVKRRSIWDLRDITKEEVGCEIGYIGRVRHVRDLPTQAIRMNVSRQMSELRSIRGKTKIPSLPELLTRDSNSANEAKTMEVIH
jgi:hypothetical protein